MHCADCKWWTEEWGCYNSNWAGTKTDPTQPVCDGISFQIKVVTANEENK